MEDWEKTNPYWAEYAYSKDNPAGSDRVKKPNKIEIREEARTRAGLDKCASDVNRAKDLMNQSLPLACKFLRKIKGRC